MKQLLALFPTLVAIVICAGLGSFIANVMIDALNLHSTAAVLGTMALSMLLSFGFFVLGVSLRNHFGKPK